MDTPFMSFLMTHKIENFKKFQFMAEKNSSIFVNVCVCELICSNSVKRIYSSSSTSTHHAPGGKRRKSEKGGKGLRHFSKKVCEKVRRKGTTSYNEVADELVAEFTNPANCFNTSADQVFTRASQALHRLIIWLWCSMTRRT
jgi:hypothetical protein